MTDGGRGFEDMAKGSENRKHTEVAVHNFEHDLRSQSFTWNHAFASYVSVCNICLVPILHIGHGSYPKLDRLDLSIETMNNFRNTRRIIKLYVYRSKLTRASIG